MTRDPIEPTDNVPKQENHPVVFSWNLKDDFYNDGMTLYADGSLHINIGGHVVVKSLRGWFEDSAQALDAARLEARKDFSKQILDMLDEVVRGTPELQSFIYPIKESIREVRDNQELQGLREGE